MRDEMNHNTLSVTGTPSLVTGALTVDPDQALSFNGSTNSASAADSASLSITGSLSIEFFLRMASYPGSTQEIVSKGGSYAAYLGTGGLLNFSVFNGAASGGVTTNVALATNTWHHVVCVYNGGYMGTPGAGNTIGNGTDQVDDDNGNNKAVSPIYLPEPALLNTVKMLLQYRDEVWDVQMRAVVYTNDVQAGNTPGALVTTSPVQILRPPNPQWRVPTWVSFPLSPALVPSGYYWIGYVSDTVADLPKAPLVIGTQVGVNSTYKRPDSVSGPGDSFGAINAATGDWMTVVCDYTPVARTGREGKLLIYLNGALNVSAAYSGGIADTTNAMQVCPTVAAQVDEISIWNKALSDVQIANHYNAH